MFWRGSEREIVDSRVRAVLADDRYSVIIKSDILRLAVLVLFGGLYVDTDFECLRSVGDLLATPGFHCGWQDHAWLCPSLMACDPGDEFASRYLDAALAELKRVDIDEANRQPDKITGPHLLTALGKTALITRHVRETFYPSIWVDPPAAAYARHYFFGSKPIGWLGSQTVSKVAPIRFDLGGCGRDGERTTVNLVGSPDIEASILDLDRFCKNGTVSEFFLSHTLEHVPSELYKAFLEHMVRKLLPGGVVHVVQTDAEAVIRQFCAGEIGFRSMRSTLFTPPDRLVGNPLQAHRNCWSATELARDMEAVGLRASIFDAGSWGMDTTDPFYPDDIRADWGKPIKNLGVVGRKPEGTSRWVVGHTAVVRS